MIFIFRLIVYCLQPIVLTPQIAGHNLKNKLGLIKFGNNDNNKKKIYPWRTFIDS